MGGCAIRDPLVEQAKQEQASLVKFGRSLKEMPGLARLLVLLGLLLLIAGGVVYLLSMLGISFGHLPGDFAWRRKNVSVYFPLGTSILVSILLTLIIYLLTRLRR
jgi:hypothetical protein